MGKRFEGMTLAEHLERAKIVVMLGQALRETTKQCQESYGKTHKTTKRMERLLADFESARSELDNEYHKVASDEDFTKYGHIYYGGKQNDQRAVSWLKG
jgi:hypothetical protein